jgi:GDP/UDP-N,N'-diacetylbacillosamine 2-epimerase (hydrolysing)
MAKRLISVFTGTRADYGLLYPVLRELVASDDFSLQLLVSGSHLDTGFGQTLSEIETDGFSISYCVELPGIAQNMALGAGALTQSLASFWAESPERPAAVLLLGDRYESLAAATAALLSGLPVAHMHGGDITGSGTLDDSIRHAISKMAHLHFPATQASAERLLKLGEESWRVTVTGASSLDNLRLLPVLEKELYCQEYGLNPDKPWILFTQHPLSILPQEAGEQARQTLQALAGYGPGIEVLATYPNHDAGSSAIIEQLHHFERVAGFHVVPSLGRERYLNILRYVTLLVGNSSSGLLESAHFQTPCLNVGERQQSRERGGNVVDVPQDQEAIQAALARLLDDSVYRDGLRHGPNPFGKGHCAETILQVFRESLSQSNLLLKQLTY